MTPPEVPQRSDGVPTYTEAGDPDGRYGKYSPAWLNALADDVTIEGSLLDGAANYRPRSSVLLLSRLVGEKLAGTPYAEYFLSGAC